MLPLGWEQQGVLPSDWELVHPVMEGPAHLFLEVANNGQLVGMMARPSQEREENPSVSTGLACGA